MYLGFTHLVRPQIALPRMYYKLQGHGGGILSVAESRRVAISRAPEAKAAGHGINHVDPQCTQPA